VLETDAPYLAPVPYRGKRNEPAYLTEIAKELAAIFGMTEEEVAEITSRNAEKVFNISNWK
jgi:TatD DNase family protein